MKKVWFVLVWAAVTMAANAQVWSNTGTGDWFEPTNWSTAVPVAGQTPRIDNAGTAQIGSGTTPALAGVTLGFGAANSGYLEVLSGGTLNATNLIAGRDGTGTVTIQSGGIVNSSVPTIGFNAGSSGSLNVYGTLNKTGSSTVFQVGRAGTGIMNVFSGGLVTLEGSSGLIIGQNNAGAVSVMTNGAITGTGIRMANSTGGSGLFTLDGGTLDLTGAFDMDNTAVSGNATLQVLGSEGTFSVGSFRTAANEYTVIDMVADAAGFTKITSSGILELNGTLNIDLSAYSGDFSTPIVLFERTGGDLTGTFDAVNITGGTGSIVYGNNTLSLIPEPGTLGLFMLGSIGALLIRNRCK